MSLPTARASAAALLALACAALPGRPAAAQATQPTQPTQPTQAPPVAATTVSRHVALGRAAEAAGRAREARGHYEAALAADSADVDASIALATLLIEENDAAAGREVIARAVRRAPADPRLLNLRIRRRAAAAADTSASGAVASDRKERARRPDDEGVGLALARVLEARGDQRGAVALYDSLLAAPSPSDRAYAAAVEQSLGAGLRARAEALWAAGHVRHPGSAALTALADRLAAGAPPR